MLNTIYQETEQRMQKSLSALESELKKIRTGRAHPSVLETIMVDYYGSPTALNQVANVSVVDPQTLSVAPWEKNLIPVIEKAIMKANIGLNPRSTGDNVIVPLPSLTEERRKELIKQAKHEAEQARVSVRNVRREANNHIKESVKEKSLSEDEGSRGEERIQQLTDGQIKKIDVLLAAKEADLIQI